MSQRDVLLIANVGNHDVQLDEEGKALLPPLPEGEKRWSPRLLGETILRGFERYRDHLMFPLLAPTLLWLREKHFSRLKDKTPLSTLTVVLYASDQPEYTSQEERAKDTRPFAEVIRKALSTGLTADDAHLQVPKKNVRIVTIEGNPADYSNMWDFYMRELKEGWRRIQNPEQTQVYLEVSGGTPAMTSMLIVAGVEVFGEHVHALYVARDAKRPLEIPIAGQLFGQKIREVLRRQIEAHTYSAALYTIKEEGHHVTKDSEKRAALRSLIRYVERRLAFDFRPAREALQTAYARLHGEHQARVGYFLRQMDTDSEANRLAELWHGMCILKSADLQEYAAFVQRVFVFRERTLRYMATQMGMEFGEGGDKYVSAKWIKTQPGLSEFLQNYPDPTKGGKPTPVDTSRPLNAFILGAITDFFLQKAPQKWGGWQKASEHLRKLWDVAELRNSGLAGHGLEGIGKADIEQAYGAGIDTLMQDLKDVYQIVFGQPMGPSPYQEAENIIVELIAD